MNDQVRYQLERAEDALRQALKLGAETESPTFLNNIVETITRIKGWYPPYKYNLTKGTENDNLKFTLIPDGDVFTNSGVRGGMANDLINLS